MEKEKLFEVRDLRISATNDDGEVEVKVGDTLEAYVVEVEPEVVLSRAMAKAHLNRAARARAGERLRHEHDAEFFLDLLPGPFDRDGLPQSLRFWKSWIASHRSQHHSFL